MRLPIPDIAPGCRADFIGDGEIRRRSAKSEDQVVVQVKRLAAAGRNPVHVDADQFRLAERDQLDAGLFDHLAASCVPDLLV